MAAKEKLSTILASDDGERFKKTSGHSGYYDDYFSVPTTSPKKKFYAGWEEVYGSNYFSESFWKVVGNVIRASLDSISESDDKRKIQYRFRSGKTLILEQEWNPDDYYSAKFPKTIVVLDGKKYVLPVGIKMSPNNPKRFASVVLSQIREMQGW